MNNLNTEIQNQIYWLTLDRASKHNAFDDALLADMQECIDEAILNPQVRVIVIKANGMHFSAGADLEWMRRMAHYSQEENIQDAMVLAKLMQSLHHSPKPTIAMVQGAAYGGGAGLAAACDIAIAADDARFCFSEVTLGLIPAVISPYVVNAIGSRAARALFVSAELFNAETAQRLGLVHQVVPQAELLEYTTEYAKKICNNAPIAVQEAKFLVNQVRGKPINAELMTITAEWIAKKRVSTEGQEGLRAFLNKEPPNWD